MSQLTQAEYEHLLSIDLIAGGKPPLIYYNVSNSQLSVARYSGAARINSHEYVYNPITDELLRADALKELAKIRRKSATREISKIKETKLEIQF